MQLRQSISVVKMRLVWDIPAPETRTPIAGAAHLREAFRENE